jgi:two-component system cell cycle sensor histidine kinase/response regulator CckA
MRPSETLAKQVQVTAMNIRERVARIHDALHALHDLTLSLYRATPRKKDDVSRWLDQHGFGFDEHGYFERLALLEKARAGEVDPSQQIYYISKSIAEDDEALFRAFSQRHLPASLAGIAQRLPDIAWFYYQDATRYVIVYPMHDPCKVVPPDFDWHRYHTFLSVHPDVNPEREIRWTPPNIDYGGKGLMVAPSIPIYDGDELLGVWSFDVPVKSLLRDCLVESIVEGQSSFIVDREGMLVAHDTLETMGEAYSGDIYRKRIAELEGGYLSLDLERLWSEKRTSLTDGKGQARFAIAEPIPVLEWLLIATFPEANMLNLIKASFLSAFEQAKGGDLSIRMESDFGDLSELASGFNAMAASMQENISEKEHALRQLDLSRKRAQLLFEASPVGLGVSTKEGELLELNSELRKMLDSVNGANHQRHPNLLTAVVSDFRPELLAYLRRGMAGGGAEPLEVELYQGKDSIRPIRVVCRRVHWDGIPALLLGIEDVTIQRRLQTQILHTQKMQAIGKLAGGISHDFNNLLTVILSNAEMLSRDLTDDPVKSRWLQRIDLAAERAAALTSQLLAFSRREVVQTRPLDLKAVIGEAEGLLQRLLEDNIELLLELVELDNESVIVRGDAGQLLQIVMNLVINARDAMAGRTGHIRVKLSKKCSDPQAPECQHAQISVSDDGDGIDPEVQQRIFEPFYTTKPHGTGLGLATVFDIVSGMDGKITVESEPGKGATFTVTLPTVREQADPLVKKTSQEIEIVGKLLLVDDEAMIRESAKQALEREGIETIAVGDGHAALEVLAEQGDAIIALITDIVMPKMSGRALSEAARELRPDLPIVFMSGYTDDTILREGIATSEETLIRKPFSPTTLLHAIHHLLSRRPSP